MKLSGTRTMPLPDSLPSFVMAFSISDGSCTSAMMGCTCNFVADSMNGREKNLPPSGTEFGLYIRATRASCGTISFNISRYFPAMLPRRTVKPVMLPPGRTMLATNPLPIGSDTATKTIGMVRVAGDRGALTENAARLEVHQLFRERLHPRGVAFGVAVLDAKVLADRPALTFKTLFEGLDASLGLRIVCEAHQHPDGTHAKLLRLRRHHLGGQCAAEQPDELAPPHTATQGQTSRGKYSRSGPCIAAESGSLCPSGVMCGRRLIDKGFFSLMQHWSGAVMCPAFECSRSGCGP